MTEAEIKNINGRVFLSSKKINIFPCSRRGQYESEYSIKHYDPEARLNTERTNRLHTAINGFKDSFIERFEEYSYTDEAAEETIVLKKLIFVLAGYRVEIEDFDPTIIAEALSLGTSDTIYAHLSLRDKISLSTEDYYTEILHRQSTEPTEVNYLDISYGDTEDECFFVGVSFVKDKNTSDDSLPSYNLPLFSYSDNEWKIVQTSLLPKIEHDTTEDSIKVSGDFTISHDASPELKVTANVAEFTVPVTVTKPTGSSAAVTVDGATWLKGTAQIDDEVTLYNKLLVKSGDTTRAEVNGSNVIFNLPVTVNNELTVHKDFETTTTTLNVDKIKTRETSSVTISSPVILENTLHVNPTAPSSPAAKVTGSLEVTSSISTETINVNTLQSVDTVKTDKVEGLLITSTATSPNRTLKVEGKTSITDELIAGNTTLNSLKVAIDKLTVTNASAEFKVPVTITGDTNSLKSPVLDVKVIKNTVTDASTGANLGVSIEDALSVTGEITAKKVVITDTNSEIKTPQLRVNRITSDEGTITIDGKKLAVNKSLEMLAKEGATEPAKATIEQVIIGDLTVKKDSKLKDSTGKITTLDLQATNNATIYDLDVGTNIDTSTLKTSSYLTVGSYVNVGSPAIPTQTTGDIVAKNSIYAENNIVAKNTLKAPVIYQTVNSIDKPVPVIDIVEQADGQWQLQISRASTIAKN